MPVQVILPAAAAIYFVASIGLAFSLAVGPDDVAKPVAALAGHGAALTMLLMQTLLGRGILSLLRLDRLTAGNVGSFLFAWATGFLAYTTLLMALSAGHLLDATTVSLSAALVLVPSAPWLVGRCRIYATIVRELWRGTGLRAGLAGALALLVLIAWALPVVIQSALPNSDWDSALYHLPMADRYLAGQLWNADPLFSAYSFPGDASLCYAAFQSLGLESAIIPFNFWVLLMAWASAGLLAARLAGPRAGLWGALVFASTHAFWQQAVDPRIDAFLTLFVLLAATALCELVRKREPNFLALAALAANAAMGVKYTGLVFGLGIVAVGALFSLWLLRGKPRESLSLGLLCLALLVVPSGFWYAGNLALHQDPFFPMLRGDYYLDRDGERQYISGDLELPMAEADPEIRRLEQELASLGRTHEQPTHLFDYLEILRDPDAYAVKPNHFVSPLGFLFLFLPLFLPTRGPARSAHLTLYGLGLGFYLLLAPITNLTRYVLPVLGLLAAGAGIVIASLPGRLLRAAFGVALALLLARNAAFEWEKLQLLRPALYLSGEADRLEWLERVGFNFTPAMASATRALNRELQPPPEQGIFMIGEGKGRLLENPYLPDSTWYMQRWLAELLNARSGDRIDYREIARSLRSQGVGYLLINRGYFDWVVRNTDANLSQVAFGLVHLQRFASEHGETIYDRDGIQVLRLLPGR